ncbi:RNA 3'-terminal phosphate cyclase [Caballeronia sp. TF1N1]|uniref:RNA 3'-terminal phosphate cyclase n=1 Tax=Caballeronia sp. TF1N1 TaxID=2878153 RepID=UPI001FD5E7DC|nr:RNA 3'-terminal phosphate cyclase [Caballeronia sp. TF1N1]
MIELDGSAGEGGGQVLRTALTLSLFTGQPFGIGNIRARRSEPGLLHRHLLAVAAAQAISGAQCSGAEVGSRMLMFAPGPIKSGEYSFDIGTAESCTLVLQTILPALLFADKASTVRIRGGTHNPMAPPAHFLQRAWRRAMGDMGAVIDIELKRFGFYPGGGGEIVATVQPCKGLRPCEWMSRGALDTAYAESFIAAAPAGVAQHELDVVRPGMGWDDSQLLVRGLEAEPGPGNALLVTLEHARVTEVFTAFGERAVSADKVAQTVVRMADRYLASAAAIGEHLGDQLLLPLALAGGGRFTVEKISMHARTNAEVIERFLPVRFEFHEADDATASVVEVMRR